MSDSDYKQRVLIQVLLKSGDKPSKILRKSQVVYGDNCMLKTHVFEWAKRFKKERESVDDDPREKAPVTARTDANLGRLCELITFDRHLTFARYLTICEDLLFRFQSKSRDWMSRVEMTPRYLSMPQDP